MRQALGLQVVLDRKNEGGTIERFTLLAATVFVTITNNLFTLLTITLLIVIRMEFSAGDMPRFFFTCKINFTFIIVQMR